jgi:hypothetical protein
MSVESETEKGNYRWKISQSHFHGDSLVVFILSLSDTYYHSCDDHPGGIASDGTESLTKNINASSLSPCSGP